MKSSPLVLCALLGATQAIKDYYYDDDTQYPDEHIKDFIEHTTKNMQLSSESKDDMMKGKPTPQEVVPAPVPVAKPVQAPVAKPALVQKQASKKAVVAKKEEENLPQPPQALSESELTAENLGKKDIETEMSNSMSDFEYLQVKKNKRLSFYVANINGPEDLSFIQSGDGGKGWHGKTITDADGDGIEDVENMDRDVLDEFYDPLVFGVAEDINNTRHGNLPGHKQLWFTEKLTQPVNHFQDIVQGSWETK